MNTDKIRSDYVVLHNLLVAFNDNFPEPLTIIQAFYKVDKIQYNDDLDQLQKLSRSRKALKEQDAFRGHLLEQGHILEVKEAIVFGSYCITPKGKMYLNMGGYSAQYHADKESIRNDLKANITQAQKDKFVMLSGVIGWIIAIFSLCLNMSSC